MEKNHLDDRRLLCKNNKVLVTGFIEEEFKFSHNVWRREFYKTTVVVERRNRGRDYVPVIVPEELIKEVIKKGKVKGNYVEIGGEFRANNQEGEDGANHLNLYLYASFIEVYDENRCIPIWNIDENCIYLNGYVCRPPVYKKISNGEKITDLMLSVNRRNNKTDHIPVVCWGMSAKLASNLEVGERVELVGRVQSREYIKKYFQESRKDERKIAYEVSTIKIVKV